MTSASAIDDLKARARILHRRVADGDPAALARLRNLPELKPLTDDQLRAKAQRRHCLAELARELGFSGWPHARAVIAGETTDFGDLLCPKHGAAYWNIWSASYDEAHKIRQQHGGFLLAYRRQYFIVESYFIEFLGLDPEDADWERIGRDWARPLDLQARQRLYGKLIRSRLGDSR